MHAVYNHIRKPHIRAEKKLYYIVYISKIADCIQYFSTIKLLKVGIEIKLLIPDKYVGI